MTSDAGLMMSLLKRTNPKGNSDRASTTAEITQRFRNDKWTYDQLVPLAKRKYVRVTGWGDARHTARRQTDTCPQNPIGKYTQSQKFEVCTATKSECDTGTGWVELEDTP